MMQYGPHIAWSRYHLRRVSGEQWGFGTDNHTAVDDSVKEGKCCQARQVFRLIQRCGFIPSEGSRLAGQLEKAGITNGIESAKIKGLHGCVQITRELFYGRGLLLNELVLVGE